MDPLEEAIRLAGQRIDEYCVRTMAQPEYIKPGEVARMLNVHPRTVSRWCDLGMLRFEVTSGGHRWIEVASIEGIEDRRKPAHRPTKWER